MILADKLIQLRKQKGWSQEELAEHMDVTRQSVSKWESGQSVPDLEKILRLSELFSVSTDYLLKDTLEETDDTHFVQDSVSLRRVSMEEANSFLSVKAATSLSIAWATFLCIVSPICLMILGAVSEISEIGLSGNAASGIGLIVMLVLVAIAVAIYIYSGSRTSAFLYLEKEPFETEYGVAEKIKAYQRQYKGTYTKYNIAGSCLCILGLVPFFVGLIVDKENNLLLLGGLSLLFVLVGIAVVLFIRGGIIWESFAKLLQEEDYTKQKKAKRSANTSLSTIYWLMITAIYLAVSFLTGKWHISWILWVVAAVLYPVVTTLFHTVCRKNEQL